MRFGGQIFGSHKHDIVADIPLYGFGIWLKEIVPVIYFQKFHEIFK